MLPIVLALAVATSTVNHCSDPPPAGLDMTIRTPLEHELYKTGLCYRRHAANLQIDLDSANRTLESVEPTAIVADSDQTFLIVALTVAGIAVGFGVGLCIGLAQ